MIIKIVLLAVVALLLAYFVLAANKTKAQASKKLVFTLFVIFMAIAIVQPGITNRIAHVVGVGRGADLLLYALALTFVFFVVSVYAKFQEQRNELHKLARRIALDETRIKQ